MLQKDVIVGRHYAIAHTSYQRLSVIRLDRELTGRGGTAYYATKLSTGRRIYIKSAAKLRCEVVANPQGGRGTAKWVAV